MAKRRKVKKTASRMKKAAPRKKRKSSGGAKRKSPLSQLTYSVSSELEEIIKTKKATRPEIVKKLWAYIKAHKLQDSKNRRLINPDHKLSAVLGKKPIDMLKLAGCISKHVS